jgi:predicted RNA-binding Zn-ribbon protein involved in translation (DUF1610 family)
MSAPNIDQVMALAKESMFGLSDYGVCLACGEDVPHVEPDARGYECPCCGEHQVYGAEEALMMIA